MTDLGHNPIVVDATDTTLWSGTKYVRQAQWIDDAGDLVTDDVFQDFSTPRELYNYLILSCGCPNNNKVNLWKEKSELESKFSTKIWELRSKWCNKHGEEYINKVLEIINEG